MAGKMETNSLLCRAQAAKSSVLYVHAVVDELHLAHLRIA